MGTIALKLFLVFAYAWLYSAGGREDSNKAVRRWLGGFLMIVGLYGLSILAGSLSVARGLAIPFFAVAGILGYGGKTFAQKFLRRSFCGIAFGGYGLMLGFLYGNFRLGIAQASLALFASLYFGLLNPDKASEEEAIIGALSTILLPFMVS